MGNIELKTKRMSLNARIFTYFVKRFAVRCAKEGKNMCDPSLTKDLASDWNVPEGFALKKYSYDKFSIEVITKGEGNKDKNLIYYLHGGGYTMPLSDAYRNAAVMLSSMTGDSDVALLDYRIAPEYVYPAALEDAFDGWNKLKELGYMPERTVVSGESAGGNLCLALTAKLRDQNCELPCALALMSPWTDLAARGESYTYNMKKDPMFGTNKYHRTMDYSIAAPYAGKTPLDDPGLSPLYGSFEGFPPMFMQVATDEMLYSDTETVFKKAEQAGVSVKAQAYKGLFHCFQVVGMSLPESKIAWQEIAAYISGFFK